LAERSVVNDVLPVTRGAPCGTLLAFPPEESAAALAGEMRALSHGEVEVVVTPD
jgi:hypothetical protein